MTKLYVLLSIVIILAIILLSIVPESVRCYNNGIVLSNAVKNAQSNLDVVYKKQYGLVDNLAEIAKKYAKFEKETLTSVIAARYRAASTNSEIPKDTIGRLLVTFENYPSLNTNEQFINLSNQLISLESEIQATKYKYNETATQWNTFIAIFPNNIIANIFHWNSYKLYVLPENVEKDAAKKVEL